MMLSSWSERRSGSPCQPGIDGIKSITTATATRPSWTVSERRSSAESFGPKRNAAPRTSRMFETTLPAIDPRTTFGSESLTAIRAMISSGALPKLALRKPPIRAPVCSAACSVDSPISHASGTSARQAMTKRSVSPAPVRYLMPIVTGARARSAQRIRRSKARVAYPAVLEAVLFDWGDTLMRWAPDPDLLEVGHAAGFAAIGREPVAGITERFRDVYLASFFEPGVVEEVEYPGQVRRLLGEFGIEVTEEELA